MSSKVLRYKGQTYYYDEMPDSLTVYFEGHSIKIVIDNKMSEVQKRKLIRNIIKQNT